MKLKTIRDVKLAGKRVLLRVDYDTPVSGVGKKQKITDDTRIKITLPTLHYLIKHNAKVIILAKRGRPNGRVVANLRLNLMAKHLGKLINKKVAKLDQTIGPKVKAHISSMKPGNIVMLENTRFLPGELSNDKKTSKALADLGDVIINECFSISHRAHASISGFADFLPMYAGFHLLLEVKMLSKLMDNPKRPLVAIVGGAKIADKVGAIQNLARIADTVLVGGGVANNFLKAEGIDVLNSYLQGTVADESKRGIDFVAFAKKLLARFKKKNGLLLHGYIPIPKIVAPVDVIAADKIKNFKTKCTLNFINPEASNCPEENLMFLDIGPSTITLYQDIIKAAKTIFWNGPLGVFEEPSFSKGTRKIADAVAKSSATSFLGGGDTIAAIAKFKLQNKYDYVSAAGGASLEFLAGKQLPGLEPMKIK